MDRKEAADLVREQLTGPVAAEEWVQHVEFDPELDRWYLRFTCEGPRERRISSPARRSFLSPQLSTFLRVGRRLSFFMPQIASIW